MNGEIYNIKLTENTKIIFPNDKPGNVFICGFIDGMFGEYDETFKCFGYCDEVAENNIQLLIDTIKNGNEVKVLGTDLVVEYMNNVICDLVEGGVFTRKGIKNVHFCSCGAPVTKEEYEEAITKDFNRIYEYTKRNNMKFDYIIQNPPYGGNLYLDFLEKGLDLLTETGKMVIIEPATWLINVKTTGNAKKYNAIKEHLSGHVESVIIENHNKDFNTNLRVPFATVTIDFSKTYESIEFVCCGEKKIVKSLYDCNLIGDYSVIWSILSKVKAHGDVMDNHTTKEKMEDGMYYTKYADIIGGAGGALCSATTDRVGVNYDGESFWKDTAFGDFCTFYTSPSYHFYKNSISSEPLCSHDKGKHLTTKIADNLYGTKSELENWKHFVFKNKLPLFINIVINVNQRNCSKDFLPWLVGRTYTDDEINEMFGFTEEEIALIDRTIKKYERNSPWFRRYICGPDSVSDEEIQKFIDCL